MHTWVAAKTPVRQQQLPADMLHLLRKTVFLHQPLWKPHPPQAYAHLGLAPLRRVRSTCYIAQPQGLSACSRVSGPPPGRMLPDKRPSVHLLTGGKKSHEAERSPFLLDCVVSVINAWRGEPNKSMVRNKPNNITPKNPPTPPETRGRILRTLQPRGSHLKWYLTR